MNLDDSKMKIIANNIKINKRNREYIKIRNSISVLNFAYLEKASVQLKHSLSHPNFKIRTSKQEVLFNMYNNHIREHQIMFLLFNIFENALRAKAALCITNKFSSLNKDDWWKDISKLDKNLLSPVQSAITHLHKEGISLADADTFNIFDTFTLGQLSYICRNYWTEIKDVFQSTTFNSYSFIALPKDKFELRINKIIKARNEIAHHKPINYTGNTSRSSLIKDVELLLCYMNFNLKEALNKIDSLQDEIPHLQYQ